MAIERFAVMTPDLKAYSFWDNSFQTCMRYCRGDSVIVERRPVMDGFSITVRWGSFERLFSFRHTLKNVLWLHVMCAKTFRPKIVRVVYRRDSADA